MQYARRDGQRGGMFSQLPFSSYVAIAAVWPNLSVIGEKFDPHHHKFGQCCWQKDARRTSTLGSAHSDCLERLSQSGK